MKKLCMMLLGWWTFLCPPAIADFNCAPDIPPRASLISISPPDRASGESIVTGAPGAVLPSNRVVLVTLSSGHYADVLAKNDGSFAATLFAPPGVSVLVKSGPPEITVKDAQDHRFMCFPATIILSGEPAVGSAGLTVVGGGGTSSAGPGWTFQGSIGARQYSPGGRLTVSGTLAITSPAVESAGTMVTKGATLLLERLSGPDGYGSLGHDTLASTFMTPTGFPIERIPSGYPTLSYDFPPLSAIYPSPFIYDVPLLKTDATHASALIDASYSLPDDLPAGYYRPRIQFNFAGIPSFGPPLRTVNNAFRILNESTSLLLPIIRVGNPAPPRLYWTLLTDDLSNGTRGVTAIEDRARFGVASRIVTQADTFIVPRTHPDTGNPVVYRLEPFAPTVSISNGSTPTSSIPIIPFRFPSGRLTVTVKKPDGSAFTIGPAPFVQSRSRALAFPYGDTISPNGGHIQDAYQLTTMDPRFEVSFTEDGRHVITMEGTIDDISGNTWSASGTYEVYVARQLSLDTAVLPGTPFEVGDVFAPQIVISPPGPVSVQVRTRLLPNSKSEDTIDTTVHGIANNFGYFSSPGGGIKLDQPSEYRVDITASFVDANGDLWMGSRTWGGVVAARAPNIIAHGRRGTDLAFAGSQWFFRPQQTNSSDHLRFPFHSGDVVWAQANDAAIPIITFQDPSGSFLSLLRSRLIQGDPAELVIGQAPLYLSRPDVGGFGADPHLDPSKVDIWGYSYTSVQRPLVRVREEILGGNTASAYWRFNDSYADQAGSRPKGDLPNNFKFQYGGVVLRGSALQRTEYAIYGSTFVLVPDNDPGGGSRVFPPFQGNGGGPTGGPLMTLKGKPIDMFFHPTAVRPGSVLETGDTFVMAGAAAPTLPVLVSYSVTSPSGQTRQYSGRANKVGYYYHPEQDFVVTESGIYTVDLKVTYEGEFSAGRVTAPFPSGDLLGTTGGRFYFYVTQRGSERLATNIADGFVLPNVPLNITASSGEGHVTVTTPGFLMETRAIAGANNSFTYRYDAAAFARDFPLSPTQSGTGDMVTITLFDSRSNTARIVTFNGSRLMSMKLPPGVPGINLSILDRGGMSLASSGTSTSPMTGFSKIRTNGGNASPAGIVIFGSRNNGTLVSETAVPATTASSFGRIFVEIGGPANTGFALVNPNDTAVTFTFFYTDAAGGVESGAGSIQIGAHSQKVQFLNEAPFKTFAGSTFQGTFSFTSTLPVGIVALRTYTNEHGDFLMSTLPVIDTRTTPRMGDAILPYYADGGGWRTQILLVNPTDTAISGAVQFPLNVTIAGQTGRTFQYSIPGRSSHKLATSGVPSAIAVGSVRIVPGNGVPAPIPLAVFSYEPSKVVVSEAAVPTVSGSAFRMYAESMGSFGQPGSIATGIAVAANAAADLSLTFELTNLDGTVTGLPTPVTRNLSDFGNARFLGEIFPTLPSPFKGVLRVSTNSASGISIVGLRARYNERPAPENFLITTTAPAVETGQSTSDEMLFPLLVTGGGYTTEFILFSKTSGQSSGAMYFFHQNGSALSLTLK